MSKELEAFVRVEHNSKRYKGRKEDLNTIFRSIQALEFIKIRKINLEYLKCCKNYEQYKTICSYWNEITKKEYELLKEVLC